MIRQAERLDLDLIVRHVKPAIGRTFEQDLDEQDRGDHTLFLAFADQTITGWGFIRWLGPRDPEAARLFPDAPEIYRLEVSELLRSTGIGRALITAMEHAAAARGYPQVSLGVGHDNPRAYALYQALGYENTALDAYYDEYEYPLDSGAIATARDLCRYLVKRVPPTANEAKPDEAKR